MLPSGHAAVYGAIAIYVLSNYSTAHLLRTYAASDLESEWLCWCFLLGLSRVFRSARSTSDDDHEDRPDRLAMAVAAVALFRAVGCVDWAVPLLSPLAMFLVHEEGLMCHLPFEYQEKTDDLARSLFTARPPHLLLALLIAAASAAVLLPMPWTHRDLGAGVSSVIALVLVYMLLIEKRNGQRLGLSSPNEQTPPPPPSVTPLPTTATAWRVVVLMTMMMLLTSKEPLNLPSISLLALGKAVQWMALIDLINRGQVLSVSTMASFSVASAQAFHLPAHPGYAWLVATVALASLVQTYRSIHKMAYSHRVVAAIGCTFLLTLFSHRVMTAERIPRAGWFSPSHPIEMLVAKGNADFARMVNGQSKTLPAAIAEYERRYRRPPPPGFDYWFQVAVESNATIIDNYDTIMNTLEPFWGISAAEMRARGNMINQAPMAVFIMQDHRVTMGDNSLVLGGFSEAVTAWLEAHQAMLPNFRFVMNGLAEPRVIVPNDRINHLISTCPPIGYNVTSDNSLRRPLEILDLGKKSAWQVGTSSCPEDSPSRSLLLPTAQDITTSLPFVTNATLSKDWCQTPEAAQGHGMFVAPYNLKVTSTLVPIFSHGKPSSSQDILYPSPDYIEQEGKYNATADIPWDEKFNQLYWAGSDTGGYAMGSNWRKFHRQRFVDLVTNSNRDVALLQRTKPSRFSTPRWELHTDTMANLSSLVDVHLSDLAACMSSTCEDEREALPVLDVPDERSVMYQHRFLFDVDGMGRTERYYRLLGSHSTVLKQTMHQEWHDDRLIPWVHYVPVSLGMEELPEILRFLALTERGQQIGKNIADQGREWAHSTLRSKDLEVAFLRLILEYVRLVSDERDVQGICPTGRTRDEDEG